MFENVPGSDSSDTGLEDDREEIPQQEQKKTTVEEIYGWCKRGHETLIKVQEKRETARRRQMICCGAI